MVRRRLVLDDGRRVLALAVDATRLNLRPPEVRPDAGGDAAPDWAEFLKRQRWRPKKPEQEGRPGAANLPGSG
jgi:hypothetical protein